MTSPRRWDFPVLKTRKRKTSAARKRALASLEFIVRHYEKNGSAFMARMARRALEELKGARE
jgi:hypothetical protein